MAGLTTLQTEVLDVLDAAYPSALTTVEVAERRTGTKYDQQDSYRALRQLEAKGLVVGLRIGRPHPTAWAVIR